MDEKLIGKKIRDARKAKKLTQKELGCKIDKTESSIRKYEKGLVMIPTNVLHKIADVLNLDIVDLISTSSTASKNNFWENVIFLRKKHHITQDYIANKLNISVSEYIKYETEQPNPSYDMLTQIADILTMPHIPLITENIAQGLDIYKDYTNNDNSIFRNNTTLLMYVLSNIGIEHVRTSIVERIAKSNELKEFMEYLVYKYDKQIVQERKEGE